MKAFYMILLISLLFFSPTALAQYWPTHNIRSNIVGAWSRAGDFNQDGKMDILVQAGDTIYWYENHVSGWLPHIIDTDFYNAAYGMVDVVDVDGDGDLDVLKSAQIFQANDTLTWNENTGNDVWGEHILDITPRDYPTTQAQVADLDGDGDHDIVMVESNYLTGDPGTFFWLENVQNSVTWTKHIIDNGLFNYCIINDVDGDGDMDIFTSGNSLSWYENQYPGTTWTSHTIEIQTSLFKHWFAVTGDTDLDGDVDLISAPDANGHVVLYTNPDWQKTVLLEEGGISASVIGMSTLFDFDLDGDLDVPYGNLGISTFSLGWIINPGNSGADWQILEILPANSKQLFLTGIGDFDEDGDMDFTALDFDGIAGLGSAFWVENIFTTSVTAFEKANAELSVSPNPSKGKAVIEYRLLESGSMELAVFTIDGKKVTVLESGFRSIGDYTASWEGKPGMYLLQLTLNKKSDFIKLIVSD